MAVLSNGCHNGNDRLQCLCILTIDRLYTGISGPHSIIYIQEATMSVVETIISATEIDFSSAHTIVSAFLTSFFEAEILISAAEKTAGAVPAGLFLSHQRGGKYE